MHDEILTKEQKEILPILRQYLPNFGLVGGTAVALHIGHRRSIDFDMFSSKTFDNDKIRDNLVKSFPIEQELVNRDGEYTLMINSVKVTFYRYRFNMNFPVMFQDSLRVADLLPIAAMKVHALGGRAKWKDYVDLYFILRDHYSMTDISRRAEELLGGEFNEKLLRERLALFFDIRYDEAIEFLPGFEVPKHTIKEFLKEISLS